jgi:hypothetical protein
MFYNVGREGAFMKKLAGYFACVCVLLLALPAFGDDQQKAQKEINKITAMATDFDGRRVVNLSISEMFTVPRAALVEQRAQTGLNYGGLFVAQELAKSGMTKDDIASKLKTGVTISDLANQQHLDWKQLAQEAKKLNAAIDNNLYSFFLGKKGTVAQDAADKYDVHYDGAKTDADISKQDIASAQDRYLLWKDRAAKDRGNDRKQGLSAGDERVAYSDHVANGGPQGGGRGASGSGGTSTPVGMGGPH